MADISAEIAAFKNAVYGEDVRDAMVSLANKLNTEATTMLSKFLTQTFYFTNPGSVYMEKSGTAILIRWSSVIAGRFAGSGVNNHDLSLAQVIDNFDSSYIATDSTGATCLKIPDAYTLCADNTATSIPFYCMKARTEVDGYNYFPVFGCVNGYFVQGRGLCQYSQLYAEFINNKTNAIVSSHEITMKSFENSMGYFSRYMPSSASEGHSSNNDKLSINIPANTKIIIRLTKNITWSGACTIYVWFEGDSTPTLLFNQTYLNELVYTGTRAITSLGVFYIKQSVSDPNALFVEVFNTDLRAADIDYLYNYVPKIGFTEIVAKTIVNILENGVYTNDMSSEISKLKSYINPLGLLNILQENAYYYSTNGHIELLNDHLATIRYYVPIGVTTCILYMAWDSEAQSSELSGYYHVFFDKDGNYVGYYNWYSGRENKETSMTLSSLTTYGGFVGFTLPMATKEQCYAYLLPSGDLLFAGSQSAYAGKTNIYE